MRTEIFKIDQNTLRNTYAEIYGNILNKQYEIMLSNVAISKAREEKKGLTKRRIINNGIIWEVQYF